MSDIPKHCEVCGSDLVIDDPHWQHYECGRERHRCCANEPGKEPEGCEVWQEWWTPEVCTLRARVKELERQRDDARHVLGMLVGTRRSDGSAYLRSYIPPYAYERAAEIISPMRRITKTLYRP